MSYGNSSTCSPYDTYDYVIVAAVSSGSAMVSALCCIFVIGLIFLFKKHVFFTQRIILYHCLAALFRAITVILRLHRLGYQNDSTSLKVLCSICGFMDQVSLWYLLVDFSVITFTLFMTAVFHKNVARLEKLFVVLIFIFPLTFNWIPFINDSYGRFGAWCWIRNVNYDNCSEHRFGFILQNVLWRAPTYIFLIILIPTYIAVVAFIARQKCCKRKSSMSTDDLTSREDTLRRTLNEEVWPLLFFPLGALLLNVFPIANEIYETIHVDDPSYKLWLATVVLSPLQGGYIALVYTLDCGTIRRLSYRNLVATICCRKDVVREYPAEVAAESESVASGSMTLASDYAPREFRVNSEKQSLIRNQHSPHVRPL